MGTALRSMASSAGVQERVAGDSELALKS
jgi:hypothetical protein